MNLHGEMINIQIDNPEFDNMNEEEKLAYKKGHRDARHKAAEMVIQAESLIEKLGDAVENAKGSFDTPIARRRIPDNDYIRETRNEMNQAIEDLKRFREIFD